MLSAIGSLLGKQIIDVFLGKGMEALQSYFNKQISIEELRTKLLEALLSTFAEIEKSHADALAKTYAAFMDALKQSKLMQVVWASVVISQLFVLLWHQLGIPAIVALGIVTRYPPSGSTVEWAYLLLAACMGMGPVVLRNGPGAGNLAETLKSIVRVK